MAYKELKSLYYESTEAYAKEYYKRFNSEEAVKLDFTIGKNQAFFLENSEVMTIAYKIQKLDKEIYAICNALPNIALNQYSKKCLIDEIVITNKIEGVHSSRKEIGEVLDILETQSETKGKKKRFLGLVNKYLKLINSEKISINNCKDIRVLYDEVFLDEVIFEEPLNKPDGKLFRKNSVSIHSVTDKVIHTGLTPEDKIIEAMDKAIDFLNDESVEKLFRVCLFHYLIEYIHPFYDGNGRLGRLIFSYGVSQTLSNLISFRISGTIKEKINAYYKAFESCNNGKNLGDLTTFLLMMLSMIMQAMEELKKSLVEKHQIWGKYEQVIDKICKDNNSRDLYSCLIQASLFSEMGLSMKELNETLSLSPYKINKILEQIPDELKVIKTKSNFKYYSINIEKLDEIIFNESLEKIFKAE